MNKMQSMKLFLSTITATILLATVLFSCSKDENNQSLVNYAAVVDGVKFNASNLYAKATYSTITKVLKVQGQNTDQTQTIAFELSPQGSSFTEWKAEKYDFDPVHIANSEYSLKAEFIEYDGTSYHHWVSNWNYVKTGAVQLQHISSSRVRGTFAFDLVKQNSDNTYDGNNIKKITEGSFDLYLNQ